MKRQQGSCSEPVLSVLKKMPVGLVVAAMIACVASCSLDPATIKAKSLASAQKYVQKQRYRDAIIEYKNALKADPTAADVHYDLGEAYLKTKPPQFEDAYAEFRRAIDLDPNHIPAQIAAGQMYLQAGENDDAEQMATHVLQRDPRSIEAHLLLASAYAAKQMMPEAIGVLTELIKEQPRLTAAHVEMGVIYFSQKKMDQAKAELEQALAVEPGSIAARKAMGVFYLSTGNAAGAEEQYRAAVQANPNSEEALLALGEFLVIQGRASEAESIYKQLIVVKDHSAESRFDLASFYVAQKRFDDARVIAEQIAKDTPDYLPARQLLVELALNSGDLSRAEALLGPLSKEHARNHDVAVLRGRLLLKQHQPQKAIEVLESSLKLGNSAPVHYFLGVGYEEVGNLQRAESEMQSAISADSHFLEAYIGLSAMMADRGLAQAALNYGEQALRMVPSCDNCLLLIGTAYAELNDFNNAEKYYELFNQRQPSPAESFVRLGYLRSRQKKYDEAAAYFEKALTINPKQYDALDGLAATMILRGNKQGAVQRIQESLASNQDVDMLDLAGKTYAESGDTATAEQVLKRAIQEAPENFSSYVLLGSLYRSESQIDQAIQKYEEAVKLRPRDLGLWTIIGVLYEKKGDIPKAQAAYTKALDLEPRAGVAANNLAWIYVNTFNDMDKALEYARRAKVALPKVPNVSDTLGWIYTRRNLNEMAVPLLQEAVKGDPKSGTYHFHLAVALMQSGKKQDSKTELAAAVKLDSGLKQRDEAKQILQSAN